MSGVAQDWVLRPDRASRESGYALLLVFLMAAFLAISLYMEIPRVAFESQRQKEQLLMFRGEQYKRAIQVFMRTNQRWPAKIEDLENTNNKRFLRQRYIDPMTGKDEWRLVHIQNGILTDSKVQTKQNQQKDNTTAIGQTVGMVAGLGFNTPENNGQAAANPAMRRRSGDPPTGAAAGTDPNAPGGGTNGSNGNGNLNAGIPPVPGSNGQTGIPGMPPGVTLPGQIPGQMPGQPGMPGNNGSLPGNSSAGNSGGSGYLGGSSSLFGGSTSASANPYQPAQGQTGVPGMPGQPGFQPGMGGMNPVTGAVGPGGYGTAQGSNGNFGGGFQQPGMNMNPQAANAAASMINGLLTQGRPGGLPTTGTNGISVMGGGIAGFASKADEDSIMVYNDQKNYGLWEFVFDPTKIKPLPNPITGSNGMPTTQPGAQIGTPVTQMGSPAGQMGSQPGGFGSQPGSFGPQPSQGSQPSQFGNPSTGQAGPAQF